MIEPILDFIRAIVGGTIGLLIVVGAYCLLHSIRNRTPR